MEHDEGQWFYWVTRFAVKADFINRYNVEVVGASRQPEDLDGQYNW